jgi:hypothetical protein
MWRNNHNMMAVISREKSSSNPWPKSAFRLTIVAMAVLAPNQWMGFPIGSEFVT